MRFNNLLDGMLMHNSSAKRGLIASIVGFCFVPATAFAQGLETSSFLWVGVLAIPIAVIIALGLLVARIAKIKRYKGLMIVLLIFFFLWFGIPILLYFLSVLTQ